MMGGGNQNGAGLLAQLKVPEAMRAGLLAEQTFGIYPENMTTVAVFSAMQTQWRIGMNGATGLDYAALPAVMDLLEVAAEERQDAFTMLRIMEGEALKMMDERRNG